MYAGGIYLPLEYQPLECMKEPLFLAYWNAHFVPLLTEVVLKTEVRTDMLHIYTLTPVQTCKYSGGW